MAPVRAVMGCSRKFPEGPRLSGSSTALYMDCKLGWGFSSAGGQRSASSYCSPGSWGQGFCTQGGRSGPPNPKILWLGSETPDVGDQFPLFCGNGRSGIGGPAGHPCPPVPCRSQTAGCQGVTWSLQILKGRWSQRGQGFAQGLGATEVQGVGLLGGSPTYSVLPATAGAAVGLLQAFGCPGMAPGLRRAENTLGKSFWKKQPLEPG